MVCPPGDLHGTVAGLADWSKLDTPEIKEAMAGYGEVGATAAAVIRGGALYPTTTSTTVQRRGGQTGKVALARLVRDEGPRVLASLVRAGELGAG
jgi:hypothetical protein